MDPLPSIAGSFPRLILRRRYLYSPSRKLPPQSWDAHGGQDGDREDSFRGHRKRGQSEREGHEPHRAGGTRREPRGGPRIEPGPALEDRRGGRRPREGPGSPAGGAHPVAERKDGLLPSAGGGVLFPHGVPHPTDAGPRVEHRCSKRDGADPEGGTRGPLWGTAAARREG